MPLIVDSQIALSKPIHKPNQLVSAWLFISSIVVIWDFMFVFARPYSIKSLGGSLSWIWTGYDMYEFIDLNYSARAYQERRGFTPAQSSMNVIEDFFNFFYLYLAHSGDPYKQSIAPVFGFTGTIMTFSKTLLYFLCDYWCGWCESGHNDLRTWVFLYLIPNGFWVLCPAICSIWFGSELSNILLAASGVRQWNAVDHKSQHQNKLKAT